ncbi:MULTISPECIES: hypothetical protein [unclassified Iodidimonas]|uniref:hypothetical protein n=1 Tax=unclassified Iodidimonas TaxID=2626145 RepID=UPI002482D9BA|nr:MULTISPECIES: hypothetical protein [unclassified Iodidimonas]
MKFIGPGFRDDIDITTGELPISHIKRREFYRSFPHGIKRNGHIIAAGQAGRIQAKGIGSAHTIDGYTIASVIPAQTGNRVAIAFIDADAGINPDNIAKIAADRRKGFQRFKTKGATRTNRQLVHHNGCCGDDDFFQLTCREGNRQIRHLRNIEKEPFNALGTITAGLNCHRVGAAGFQTAGSKATLIRRLRCDRSARTTIGDADRRIHQRLTRWIGDNTPNA